MIEGAVHPLEVCVVARPRNELREVHRIIETMQNGPGIARIEIHITIVPGKTDEASGSESVTTPLEEWRKKKGRGQS
jgi:hypothetical protein